MDFDTKSTHSTVLHLKIYKLVCCEVATLTHECTSLEQPSLHNVVKNKTMHTLVQTHSYTHTHAAYPFINPN